MFSKLQEYAKLIVVLISGVSATTWQAIIHGVASPETLITALLSVLTAFATYKIPNKPQEPEVPAVEEVPEVEGPKHAAEVDPTYVADPEYVARHRAE